mmetsp:Transcript_22722/g.48243  ORF Transcript_22722/g.48243 Transcript_22722/m.48243 type:complete len:247 (-) Transcript_22722:318-1058(-)
MVTRSAVVHSPTAISLCTFFALFDVSCDWPRVVIVMHVSGCESLQDIQDDILFATRQVLVCPRIHREAVSECLQPSFQGESRPSFWNMQWSFTFAAPFALRHGLDKSCHGGRVVSVILFPRTKICDNSDLGKCRSRLQVVPCTFIHRKSRFEFLQFCLRSSSLRRTMLSSSTVHLSSDLLYEGSYEPGIVGIASRPRIESLDNPYLHSRPSSHQELESPVIHWELFTKCLNIHRSKDGKRVGERHR